MTDLHPLVHEARRLADDVLFPRSLDTDTAGTAPTELLDLLRDAGMYGIFSPTSVGGSGLAPQDRYLIQEALAGACLTTAFVWQQHGGAAMAAATTDGPMSCYATPLAAGAARGGVAFAHLLRSGDPILVAEPEGDGWRFTGTAPFVTGWGTIDLVLTAARHGEHIVWALLDGATGPGVSAERLHLAAIDSSDTYAVHYDQHLVPAERVTSVMTFDDWYAGYRTGLRANGSLALGVAARCLRLLGPSALDEELAAARYRLDTSCDDDMPEARGRMGALCLRSAGALLARSGGAGVFLDQQAQRLGREALFLLVQGQTPEIKAVHLRQFGAS